MKEQEIIGEVKHFLEDTVYNYAMLIDGEWGCGKTHFIKNELTSAIESQYGEKGKVKYVSLYGCKSVEDIQNRILWLFVEEKKKELFDKEQKEKAKVDKEKTKEKGIGDNIFSSSVKLIGGLVKNKLQDLSLSDVAWEWIDIKAYVFVFDDLERCECKLNELFGFLNELVEHEGAKIILVANESEITTELLPENIAQQYMISLCDKIAWPKFEEEELPFSVGKSNDNKTQISFDELDARRRYLFSTAESNEEYKRMREKLIGITIKYEPDVDAIVTSLVENSCVSAKQKKVIARNIEYFAILMGMYNHHNLRTVQFFLSRIPSVLAQLSKIKISPDYKERIEDYITQECFKCSVEFKSDYHEKKDSLFRINLESDELQLITIRNYITSGRLSVELFKRDIKQIESVLKARIEYDDPYNKLNREYLNLTQKECEDALDAMINRLGHDKYPVEIYEEMLILIARLKKLGFPDKYATWVKNSMIKNLKEHDISVAISVDRFYFDEEDKAYAILSKLVQEINTAILVSEKTKRRKNLGEIVEEPNWVERLEDYTTRMKEKGISVNGAFAQVKAQKWVDAILNSSSRTIHDFRKWMWKIYPQSVRVSGYEKDWKTLSEIHDAINPEKESDLIKRYALELVRWQIEEVYKINTGEPYLEQQ